MSGSIRGSYVSKKTGASERYDSSYELRRFMALDASPLVESWTKKHGIRIPYMERGKWRRYVPDILVVLRSGERILEEVKGKVFDRINFGRKNLAASGWCITHGMAFRVVFLERLDVV